MSPYGLKMEPYDPTWACYPGTQPVYELVWVFSGAAWRQSEQLCMLSQLESQ